MIIFFNKLILLSVPIILIIYWFGPKKWRDIILILWSLFVLFLVSPALMLFMLILTLIMIKLCTAKVRVKPVNLITLAVMLALTIILIGKYGETIWNFCNIGRDYPKSILIPIGVSYIALRIIQVVFDLARGTLRNPTATELLLFFIFIPTFPAGPIEPYQGFYAKRQELISEGDVFAALGRITLGYFKKSFIVGILLEGMMNRFPPAQELINNPQILITLVFVSTSFIRAYFDLSAYTDLAIGFSRLFGFRIMENFNYPFLKKNLSEFWNSWHISLSNWCRNNVYFPVFGITRKPWLAMYASMLTMGIWHYASLNWLAWGLHHATGLVFLTRWNRWKKHYSWLNKITKTSVFKWASYVFTFYFVAIGYAFVSTSSFNQGVSLYIISIKAPILLILKLISR